MRTTVEITADIERAKGRKNSLTAPPMAMAPMERQSADTFAARKEYRDNVERVNEEIARLQDEFTEARRHEFTEEAKAIHAQQLEAFNALLPLLETIKEKAAIIRDGNDRLNQFYSISRNSDTERGNLFYPSINHIVRGQDIMRLFTDFLEQGLKAF